MRGGSLLLLACVVLPAPALAAPFDPASLRNKGAALLDNGEEAKAIEIFRDLVKRFPTSAPDHVNLAIALLNHNDLESAEAELRKAIETDPRDQRAHYNLGIVLKRRGKNEDAAAQLAVVASSPVGAKDASVHYNLGILYKRLRRSDEALAAFRRAVEIRPEHASAHFQIYNEMVQKGDKAKAQPELDLFKLLQKATPDFQRTEAYLERGELTRILAPGPAAEVAAATGQKRQATADTSQIRFERREMPGAAGAGSGKKSGQRRAPVTAIPGAVLADFDGDGTLDLAFAPSAEGPVRIVRQKPAGVFSTVLATIDIPHEGAEPAGAAARKGTGVTASGGARSETEAGDRGVLVLAAGDADNDGDLDIAVAAPSSVRLLLNDGKGRFIDATSGTGLEGAGGASDVAWLDADRDGDLDLALAGSAMGDRPPRLYLNASMGPSGPAAAAGSGGARAEGSGSTAGGGGPRSAGSAALGGGASAERAPGAGGKEAAAAVKVRPRFIAAGAEAVLPPCGERLAFSDFRGRDDPDLAYLCSDGTVYFARNLRAGRFQVERRGEALTRDRDTDGSGARARNVPVGSAAEASDGGTGRLAPARAMSADRPEIVAGDLDGDGRTDLTILFGGSLSVLWGEADGGLTPPAPLATGLAGGAAGLALLDADGDGDLDVASLVRAKIPGGASGGGGAGRAASAGMEGKREILLLRNDGARRFSLLSGAAPDLPPIDAPLIAGDVDGDGDPDFVAMAGSEGSPLVLLNVTKGPNRFLRIVLGSGKSNRFGIGAKVEVRAERLVVRRECDGGPVLVGIGPRGRVDAVQVVWPTGVSQDLVDVPAGVLKIEERREFAGSCPFLYAWDGSRFRFVGEALSGAPIGFLRPDGTFEKPRPVEHLRLPAGLPAPREGWLSVRLTEEMRELTALDSVRLVAVDHPEEVEVYSNERLRETKEPFRFLAVTGLRSPSAAAALRLDAHPEGSFEGAARRGGLSQGDSPVEKALEALRALDDRAPEGFATLGPRLEGLAVPHALVLRFESVPDPPEALALVLDGWVAWTTSDVSRALLQAREARRQDANTSPVRTPGTSSSASDAGSTDSGTIIGSELESFAGTPLPPRPEPWGPALELRSGETTAFEPDLGLPIGPTMVAPLPQPHTSSGLQPHTPSGLELRASSGPAPHTSSGLEPRASSGPAPHAVPGGDLEVRIGTNLAVYYDRIRLGRLVDAPLEVHELSPVQAELRWRGVAAVRRQEDALPPRPDYDDVSPLSPFARLPDETTRSGEVLPLLAQGDGQMVIFGTGEEVSLDFDARALPPPAPGLARTWFLVSRGYARDGDPNTEPLPWGD